MEHVALHTIELVFTDGSNSRHQVIGLGLAPVFDEAEKHFMEAHALDDVALAHLEITNTDDIVIAHWPGVTLT